MTSITTISKPVIDVLIKEKGSKFIGFAFPVSSESEANLRLQEIRNLHPKATHHCYAYRIGLTGNIYRANDDGEPNGSAGLPIYNQLLAHEVTNVLIIVVRYYGGTKLGVSGLVKTYKETAKETLTMANITQEELYESIAITFPFEIQNQIFTLLNKHHAKNIDFSTSEKCHITARIPLAQKENISNQLSEIYTVSFQFEE